MIDFKKQLEGINETQSIADWLADRGTKLSDVFAVYGWWAITNDGLICLITPYFIKPINLCDNGPGVRFLLHTNIGEFERAYLVACGYHRVPPYFEYSDEK